MLAYRRIALEVMVKENSTGLKCAASSSIITSCISVERFTKGTELMGAAEVQLQSDLIR